MIRNAMLRGLVYADAIVVGDASISEPQAVRMTRLTEVIGAPAKVLRGDGHDLRIGYTDKDDECHYEAVVTEDGTLTALSLSYTEKGLEELRKSSLDDPDDYAGWTDIEGGELWERAVADAEAAPEAYAEPVTVLGSRPPTWRQLVAAVEALPGFDPDAEVFVRLAKDAISENLTPGAVTWPLTVHWGSDLSDINLTVTDYLTGSRLSHAHAGEKS